MTPGGIRKAEKEKEQHQKMDNFDLLDTLFAFIGGSKEDSDINSSRKLLNLDSSRSHASRATAGTTTALPGINEVERPRAQFSNSEEEELLPVSCGYFINIVRMLLMKQRKVMLRYILLHTEGRAFDRLIKYIKYHSLSDLLMEMMQLTVGYQESPGSTAEIQALIEGERDDTEETDNTEEHPAPKLTTDQQKMMLMLEKKKRYVVKELIMTLSHKNHKDIEASLNASAVLIDLVETEKTFGLFMVEEAELTKLMLTLAIDPSNSHNQQYLLQILLAVTKQLRPSSQQQNVFKDVEEDDSSKGFDPETQNGKNILALLNIVQEKDILFNLLISINSMNSQQSYVNQQQVKIKKIGLTRLRSLELMQNILTLMHPGYGALARAQTLLMDPNADLMGGINEPINMVHFVPNSMRRQIVKTVLVVMKEYSFCSIANQLCILILDQIKTLLDVVDVVSL